MSRKPNFDINVDGRTNERTNGRTEIWTPISHPAISRCDKKIFSIFLLKTLIMGTVRTTLAERGVIGGYKYLMNKATYYSMMK